MAVRRSEKHIVVWLALAAFVAHTATADPVKPGKNDACAASCVKTFAPHTSTQESSSASVKACSQGCQLFALLQFAGKSQADGKSECTSACAQAYETETTVAACKSGCEHETPFTGGQMEISISSDSPLYSYMRRAMDLHMEDIFDKMNNFGGGFRNMFAGWPSWMATEQQQPSGIADKSSDSSASSDSDSDSKEKPEKQLLGRPDGHELGAAGRLALSQGAAFEDNSIDEMFDRMHDRMQHILRQVEQDLQQADNWQRLDDDEESTLQSVHAYEPSPPTGRHQRHHMMMGREMDDREATWYACLARRARRLSHMTRSMVCVAMLLCITSMLFICVAIVRTAPRRRLLHLQTTHATSASAMPYKLPPYAKTDMLNADCEFTSADAALVHNGASATPPPPYEDEQQDEEKKVPDNVV